MSEYKCHVCKNSTGPDNPFYLIDKDKISFQLTDAKKKYLCQDHVLILYDQRQMSFYQKLLLDETLLDPNSNSTDQVYLFLDKNLDISKCYMCGVKLPKCLMQIAEFRYKPHKTYWSDESVCSNCFGNDQAVWINNLDYYYPGKWQDNTYTDIRPLNEQPEYSDYYSEY